MIEGFYQAEQEGIARPFQPEYQVHIRWWRGGGPGTLAPDLEDAVLRHEIPSGTGEGEMATEDYLSVRDAADALDLERPRLYRLARYMHVAPGDKCIPAEVVARASVKVDRESRYQVVLQWFLSHLTDTGISEEQRLHSAH